MVLKAQESEEQLLIEKVESDAAGIDLQSTPLNTILALREATRNKDFEKAGEYLDRRYTSEELEGYSDEELVKALAYSNLKVLSLTLTIEVS